MLFMKAPTACAKQKTGKWLQLSQQDKVYKELKQTLHTAVWTLKASANRYQNNQPGADLQRATKTASSVSRRTSEQQLNRAQAETHLLAEAVNIYRAEGSHTQRSNEYFWYLHA